MASLEAGEGRRIKSESRASQGTPLRFEQRRDVAGDVPNTLLSSVSKQTH